MRYTISEMASLLGVTTHTLRYYEKMGLIRPADSTSAGSCARRNSRWKSAGS